MRCLYSSVSFVSPFEAITFHLVLAVPISCARSAQTLDELASSAPDITPESSVPGQTPVASPGEDASGTATDASHKLTFMHIPSAGKPVGQSRHWTRWKPGCSGLINNSSIPFVTGLSGTIPNVVQSSGNNLIRGGNCFPVVNGVQLAEGMSIQKLMFRTLVAINNELTKGRNLGSRWCGLESLPATEKPLPTANQHESTDGVETLLQFTVYEAYL
ncbi:hypothetical protein Nepgr_014158 [Nepenthes gracilis]|uniref:Uncharacterized protein n=1 Tax=Nepenthes gracilis TaxID=150966 RepID=A0AAD3SKI4_NEPGR|nr:hypothetical protein Nepgr_014158 [Nepenthes gracilis]